MQEAGAARGLAAVAIASAMWALGAVVAAGLFEAGVTPFQLTAARAVLAAGGLLLLERPWKARRGPGLGLPHLIAFGLSITLVTASYFVAIERLSVAVAIVIQYTAPVLVVVWAALVARRQPSARVLVALLGSFTGVLLISRLITTGIGNVDIVGLMAALGSAVFFAGYALLSERASAVYGPVGAMLRAFSFSASFWVLFLLFGEWPRELFDIGNLPGIVFVGIGGTLVPFLLFIWGVSRVRAERAAIAATLEPVLAALAAWLWLEQPLSEVQIAGGVLVIAAVLSLQAAHSGPILPPDV